MQLFTGSIALIRHPQHLEQQWLAHQCPQTDVFDFVCAERLEQELFRECLDREIAWVTGLQRHREYLISSVARLHLDLPAQQADEDDYAIEFYVVDLYGPAGMQSISASPRLRWLTAVELFSGATDDAHRVSPRLVSLLKRADVIRRPTDCAF